MREHGLIYHSEASYSHQVGPTGQARADADDVHPFWGIHLHYPERKTGDDPGNHLAMIPHARLESMCARFGFDPDDMATIVDTLLHLRVPSPNDPLSWAQPGAAKVMTSVAGLPDPADPRLPYPERRDVLLAHAAAVRTHMHLLEAAPLADREGAVAARVFATAADQPGTGFAMPEVPADPLAALVSARLDPSRVAARRARDEWLLARADSAAERAAVALKGPNVFGFNPPAL